MVHTNPSGWPQQWVSEWPRTSLSDSGLYGLALWRIAAKARPGMEAGLSKDKYWEDKVDATTGLVTIYKWEPENALTRSRSSGYLTSHVSAPAAERLFWQWIITFQVRLIKTSARNRTNRKCSQPAACDAEGGGANGWKQSADVMEGQHELSSQVTCCVCVLVSNLQISPASCFFCSEPSFGHYNKDGILDVVIEEDAGNNSKRVRWESRSDWFY